MDHMEKEQLKLQDTAAQKKKEDSRINVDAKNKKLFEQKKPFKDVEYEGALIRQMTDKREAQNYGNLMIDEKVQFIDDTLNEKEMKATLNFLQKPALESVVTTQVRFIFGL
jgi:hypothetical protein